jgi:hypothetical protein
MNVAHEFGGQVLFSSVFGLASSIDHAFFRFDRGFEGAAGTLMPPSSAS